MAENQVADPVKDNSQTVVDPAKGGTALTDGVDKSTSPLADGAPPKLPHAWMEGLTAEQKADAELVKTLSKFEKGIPDFAKAYPELEKKLGQSVMVPNEKATPEEKARYLKAIGVPDKPEDYKLDKVELPDGIKLDDERMKAILAVAHKNSVPQVAINEIVKTYLTGFAKDVGAAMKLVKTTQEEATTALRAELKGDYDAAIKFKDRALVEAEKKDPALLKAFTDMMNSTGIGNHPVMVKMYAMFGRMIGEHAFVDGSTGSPETGTPGQRTDAQIASALYPEKK